MKRDFYNTTRERGAQLRLFRKLASAQDAEVLTWFEQHPRQAATPSEVHAEILATAPLTSIRRAITNLTKAGRLRKTPSKRIGPYGRPECVWKLNRTH